MPNIDNMKTSKFLKKSDLGDDDERVLTIAAVDKDNVGTDENEDLKWVLRFREEPKAMVLNWTNMQLCASVLGSRNTDDWIGKRILVWHDPAVMFKGEMKGGLRIRKAPKAAAGQAAEGDVPF